MLQYRSDNSGLPTQILTSVQNSSNSSALEPQSIGIKDRDNKAKVPIGEPGIGEPGNFNRGSCEAQPSTSKYQQISSAYTHHHWERDRPMQMTLVYIQ